MKEESKEQAEPNAPMNKARNLLKQMMGAVIDEMADEEIVGLVDLCGNSDVEVVFQEKKEVNKQ